MKVVIFYGPPGAGKGTQADLLAKKSGLFHFDTGKYIEQLVHDPKNKKNKIIQREKKNFDSGKLTTPSWILKIVKQKIIELAKGRFGIVFSGSPRTVFEAFGSKDVIGLMSILKKHYGKKNITIFRLKVSPETSIRRNSNRLVCSVCGTPVLKNSCTGNFCPNCGAPFRRRTLDVPKVIKVRLKEYRERTTPILAGLKRENYRINIINAERPPYLVHKEILKKLK